MKRAWMLIVLAVSALAGACAESDIGTEYIEVSEEESGLQFYGPGLAGGYRQFLTGVDDHYVRHTSAAYGPKSGQFPFARIFYSETPPDRYFARSIPVEDTLEQWFTDKEVEVGSTGSTVNAIGRIDFVTAIVDGASCVVWLQAFGEKEGTGAGTGVINGFYCRGYGLMMTAPEAASVVKLVGHREHGAIAAPRGWETSSAIALQPKPNPATPEPPKAPSGKGTRGGGSATATGFFINARGNIITNAHVVEGCQSIEVRGFGPATVLAVDRLLDLAALELMHNGKHKFAYLRGNRPIRVGQDVVVFGYPLSSALSSTGNLTKGSISALVGIGNDTSRFQITAPIQPGNSGGPMFDSTGSVAGVIVSTINPSATYSRTGAIPQNVNFAIKGTFLKSFLEAYRIEFSQSNDDKRIEATEIADLAQDISVFVTCWIPN